MIWLVLILAVVVLAALQKPSMRVYEVPSWAVVKAIKEKK